MKSLYMNICPEILRYRARASDGVPGTSRTAKLRLKIIQARGTSEGNWSYRS
jgi:hypothetical protein